MPASNMGGTPAGNPSAGRFVLMDPFSGPKGSPLDKDGVNNQSTGALSTGIGCGVNVVINPPAPAAIIAAGFSAVFKPGTTMPDGSQAPDARLVAIGGGRSGPAANGIAPTNPFNAQPLLGFGNGGSRDAGAGPAFTGFPVTMCTAAADTAVGGAIIAAFLNRGPGVLKAGYSTFGSGTNASPAVV
jgi:hypothetical protein